MRSPPNTEVPFIPVPFDEIAPDTKNAVSVKLFGFGDVPPPPDNMKTVSVAYIASIAPILPDVETLKLSPAPFNCFWLIRAVPSDPR